MKIIPKAQSVVVKKSGGTNVWYYLFDEYELHYNELEPNGIQDWHNHERIEEVIYVVEGELLAEWIEDGKRRSATVTSGDLLRIENSIHTLKNPYRNTTTFLVFKMIPSGNNYRDIFQQDKRKFHPSNLPG